MNLYNRDYLEISKEELNEAMAVKKAAEAASPLSHFHIPHARELPKAYRHFESLFPNNYLDFIDLYNKENELRKKLFEYNNLINDSECNESDLLRFIKEQQAYFIIGSILKRGFDFGHHNCFVFPEFPLSNTYKVDYLIVGGRTGGFEFVFVELEAIYGKITLKDGNLGDSFRKGLKQIGDWKAWIHGNFHHLIREFEKHSNKIDRIPREFRVFDPTRIHYAVVCGMRANFTDKTYEIKRQKKNDSQIHLRHYENLSDTADEVLINKNY